MSGLYIDDNVHTGLHSVLERKFIREYLLGRGFYLEDVEAMPAEDAKKLMTEACRYASLKLAEMESKAKFRQKLTEVYQA